MRTFTLMFFLFISTLEALENSSISFDGQYRGRFDIYNGVNKAAYGDDSIDAKGNSRGKSNDTIYLQQIIAGFTYTPSADWKIKAYMYDSRSWGSSLEVADFTKNSGTPDEYGMSFYDDHFELFETYIQKHNFLSKNLTFRVGRQQLGYGDSRIFGPGKWGNTIGWLWDGTHLSYKKDNNFIDLWYGQTRIKDSDDFSILEQHRYQGVGLYSHYEFSSMKIEPFGAWKNNLHTEVSDEFNYYYGGARVYDLTKGFIYDITGVKQIGSYSTKGVDAYAYVLKGGYKSINKYEPTFTLAYIYASGDNDLYDNKVKTFTTPFGSTDGSHYGRMDVMAWINMSDIEAKFSIKPMPKINLQFEYHHFNLADAADKWYNFGYKNKVGNSYTHIGDEYDITINYKATKDLNLLAICAYMKSGDFITANDIAQNDASKVFLQFLYKFSTN